MQTRITGIFLTAILATFSWFGPAQAALVTGTAVGSAGSETQVGSTAISTVDGFSVNAIQYFIPLDDPATGTYGVTPITCGNGAAGTAGTCYDLGRGTGYVDSDALFMNIYFDLSSVATPVTSASLSFLFGDLDLSPNNDPDNFFESISLSYWKWSGPGPDAFEAAPILIRDTMTSEGELPDSNVFIDTNAITWNLALASLMDLNDSIDNAGGFWIQLGFGSLYDVACTSSSSYYYKYKDDCKDLKNTPEFLVAKLDVDVSEVPVPAAVWLFGTALIGFIGLSRRTSV